MKTKKLYEILLAGFFGWFWLAGCPNWFAAPQEGPKSNNGPSGPQNRHPITNDKPKPHKPDSEPQTGNEQRTPITAAMLANIKEAQCSVPFDISKGPDFYLKPLIDYFGSGHFKRELNLATGQKWPIYPFCRFNSKINYQGNCFYVKDEARNFFQPYQFAPAQNRYFFLANNGNMDFSKFFVANPTNVYPLLSNKQKLLLEYSNQFVTNFPKLAGSSLWAQQISGLPDLDVILQAPVREKAPSIRYELKNQYYQYRPYELYVDFANELIGGGVLEEGNVQEEIMLSQSSLLAQLPKVRSGGGCVANSPNFCPSINFCDLQKNPAVIEMQMISNFDQMPNGFSVYAHNIDRYTGPITDILKPLANPIPIFIMAIAAPNLRSATAVYTEPLLREMLNATILGYFNAFAALKEKNRAGPYEVHTGALGTGAFKNSHRLMWALQYLAVHLAYDLFAKKFAIDPGVHYSYNVMDAGRDNAYTEAQTAEQEFLAMVPNAKVSAGEALRAIWQKVQTDPAWQKRP